ncbi:unnamed protein product [Diamesa hyperborea]
MSVSKKVKRKEDFAFINQDEERYYHHKDDMNCCKRNLDNILAKAKKVDAKKVRMINKEMEHKLGPPWFQELSNNQIAAANNLFPALEDDAENCQYIKVKYVLFAIGLHPLPKKSEIMAGIRFSRNNDLAFLWFLFETVYYGCEVFGKKKEYSLNERLVLSSICHLDMMTTLRELDRLLPVAEKKEKKPKKEKVKCIKKKYDSPYDEPVMEPKLQPSRHLIPLKMIHPKFEIYQLYRDPFYIIQNESNRWYAYEKLANPATKKIVTNIVEDQLAKIVNDDFDREKILKSLCEKHRKDADKNETLMSLLTDCPKPADDNDLLGERLENYSSFEKGVIYGVQLELAKTEVEFKELAEKYQKQVIIKTLLRQILQNATDLKYIHLCTNCEQCMESYKLYPNIVENNQCREMNQLPDVVDEKNHFDYNHCHQETQQFFTKPTRSSAYSFDYEHIFSTNTLRDVGPVKNAVFKALELDNYLTEESAITVCLKDIWQYELKLWNEKYEADQDEKATKIVTTQVGRKKQEIFKLLKNAIKLMKKNPKFVLAALSGAHRLPILREWILNRYGIKCTPADIKKKDEANKIHRGTLEKIGVVPRIKIPSYKHFGIKDSSISYDQAVLLRPKIDKWIKQYYKDLALGTIQRNRCYWATMEPYLCNTEGMRRIFYAYAPCCEKQFHPHNSFVL